MSTKDASREKVTELKGQLSGWDEKLKELSKWSASDIREDEENYYQMLQFATDQRQSVLRQIRSLTARSK